MEELTGLVERVASETGFSGVVRVDREGGTALARAFGLAHRALGVPNTPETRCNLASGGKGLTALTVVSLIEDGTLGWDTPARSVLGEDLPLISDAVTVEHLLGHRSGIGDYLDEDDQASITDYVMPVPVHRLRTTEDYLAVLDGHRQKFQPGTDFSYCNGGYVVLALIAERASGTPFHDLVLRRVCEPAGMRDAAFLRSDELPGSAALGYLWGEGDRTNVLHLPVRGSGDGGVYASVGDVHALWSALFDGRIVAPPAVEAMTRPGSTLPSGTMRYGLGFWLRPSGRGVVLEGYDAGVSFRSSHDPERDVTHTVVSNTSEGAWPMVRALDDLLLTR